MLIFLTPFQKRIQPYSGLVLIQTESFKLRCSLPGKRLVFLLRNKTAKKVEKIGNRLKDRKEGTEHQNDHRKNNR